MDADALVQVRDTAELPWSTSATALVADGEPRTVRPTGDERRVTR